MRIIFCLMVFLFIEKNTMLAQQLSSFVEYGAALHTGDNTPLWQVSNQQGLTSLDNNTYIRGGASYKHQNWKMEVLKKHWIWLQQPDSVLPPSLYSRLT